MISFKELDSCYLKATSIMEINGRTYQPGEVIARFDELLVAGLDLHNTLVSANGGFDNRAHVFWETTKELQLAFSQGVFSKLDLALSSNSLLNQPQQNIIITQTEKLESDENGVIQLLHTPINPIFIYDANTGAIIDFTQDGDKLVIQDSFREVVIDYNFEYQRQNVEVINIGQHVLNGFLQFEGKLKFKDRATGQVATGIIKIPKLKLVSDLSIVLGLNGNHTTVSFKGVGVPTGTRQNSHVAEFFFLDSYIDSDI